MNYVYILASKKKGVLYIGVTSDISKRMNEHLTEAATGFTSRYHVYKLVYLEQIESITSAIQREKQLKKWNRNWKIELIEKHNPEWEDLSQKLHTDTSKSVLN